MSDTASIIQTVVSGVLTGGASAATTILAMFKDTKKRLTELEVKVGSEKETGRTGLFYALEILSDTQRRMRREIDGWSEDPPDWVLRAIRRSSITMETREDLESRVEARLRSFDKSIKRLEEELDRREEAMERSNPGIKTFLTREEYEEDSRRRIFEMNKMKENLSSANTWLRGVLTALGYIDSEPNSMGALPPPPKTPRNLPLPPRRGGTDR